MAKKRTTRGSTNHEARLTGSSPVSRNFKGDADSQSPSLSVADRCPISLEPGDQVILNDDLNDLDIFEYFRVIDLESGKFISESPSGIRREDTTLTPIEREQISQWNLLRAVQLRLAYLRVQFYHRNSIHKYDRPDLYATLRLANWTKVFLEFSHGLKNQSYHFRSTLRAIARWRDTANWAREAIDAANRCWLLNRSPIGAKIFVGLQMVMSALRVHPAPESALIDETLDSDKRRRIPILMIRRSLRYLDQSCRSHLLEAEASISILADSLLGNLSAPEWMDPAELMSFRATIRKKEALDEDDLKKARAAYAELKSGQTMKNRSLKSLGIGSNKAQAIKEKMREEGLDKSPRRKPRQKRPS